MKVELLFLIIIVVVATNAASREDRNNGHQEVLEGNKIADEHHENEVVPSTNSNHKDEHEEHPLEYDEDYEHYEHDIKKPKKIKKTPFKEEDAFFDRLERKLRGIFEAIFGKSGQKRFVSNHRDNQDNDDHDIFGWF